MSLPRQGAAVAEPGCLAHRKIRRKFDAAFPPHGLTKDFSDGVQHAAGVAAYSNQHVPRERLQHEPFGAGIEMGRQAYAALFTDPSQ